MTLTAPPKALEQPVVLQLEGRATIRRILDQHRKQPLDEMSTLREGAESAR